MITLNNFEEPDTLELIFTMQRKLADAINSERYPGNTEERISALCTAMIHETVELQRPTLLQQLDGSRPLAAAGG